MRLVLASASPRRADLLRRAGFTFDVMPAEVDESPRPGETPGEYVLRLASEKADAAAARACGAIVIGADTTVAIGDEILGKPSSDADAIAMLTRLSGRMHEVMTGVCVRRNGWSRRGVETTKVFFRVLSPDEIRAYVATGEPRDKAGAYAVQGGASRFVERLEGSHSNVVGLPLRRLGDMLRECGLAPPVQPPD
jgi:nucleoside triphosphate pyrophosphatase